MLTLSCGHMEMYYRYTIPDTTFCYQCKKKDEAMTGKSLITSDAVKDVLRAAKLGFKTDNDLNAEAMRKCRTHGWIQGGEDEPLALTSEGRKAWDALKL